METSCKIMPETFKTASKILTKTSYQDSQQDFCQLLSKTFAKILFEIFAKILFEIFGLDSYQDLRHDSYQDSLARFSLRYYKISKLLNSRMDPYFVI